VAEIHENYGAFNALASYLYGELKKIMNI